MHKSHEPQRGRPQKASLTHDILAATLKLVAQAGFRDMRIEDIAAEVGTSKQALYRRWPTKSVLVAEAIREALSSANPIIPDTGTLREDLVELLSNLLRALHETPLGGAIRAIISETHDEELTRCLHDVEHDRRQVILSTLRRAQARNELPPERDIELDADLLLGAAYFRFLIRRMVRSPNMARSLVEAWQPDLR